MDAAEFNKRIERLRFANRWSWEELAHALGLSRVMLFHLRKGTHNASGKTLQRLTELERKSGVETDARQWIRAISERAQEQRIKVTEGDVARGFLVAEVEYLVQERPAEFKATVQLTRPAVRDAAGLIEPVTKVSVAAANAASCDEKTIGLFEDGRSEIFRVASAT